MQKQRIWLSGLPVLSGEKAVCVNFCFFQPKAYARRGPATQGRSIESSRSSRIVSPCSTGSRHIRDMFCCESVVHEFFWVHRERPCLAYKKEECAEIFIGGGARAMTYTPRNRTRKEYVAIAVGALLFASLFTVGIAASYIIVS